MDTTKPEEFKINTRLKLAALWTSVMFLYVYGDIFSMFDQSRLKDLLDGQTGIGKTTPYTLLAFAILMTIPALMISASLILRPKLARWLNIIFGTFFTLIIVLTTVTSRNPMFLFYRYLGVVEIATTLLIVLHAWRWQKKNAE